MTVTKRDPMFLRSDLTEAAEEFIEAVAEHADPSWEPGDKEPLVEELVDRAVLVLRDPGSRFTQ